jgi:hypothetical protein
MAGADVVGQVIADSAGDRDCKTLRKAQASKGKVAQQDLCQACAAYTLDLLLEDIGKQLQGEG